MVAACTAGKVGKVASLVGKIFVVRPASSTTKTTILPHKNYPLIVYTYVVDCTRTLAIGSCKSESNYSCKS